MKENQIEIGREISSKESRVFPHPAFLEQISAQQPPFWLIALLYVSPFWLLSSVFRLVQISWPAFSQSYGDHPETYRAFYFAVQSAIIGFIVIACSIRFRAALWKSCATGRSTKWKSILTFLPVLCVYALWTWWRFRWIDKSLTSNHMAIDQIHDSTWSGAPYGPSPAGVLFSSAMMICGPVFEEIIFTGFLLNSLSKRFGVLSAVFAVPVIFTAVHIPQQGWGLHLVPIFVAGLTFVLMRLASGKLIYTVIGHMVINGIFLLPMWIEAYYFFNSR